MQTVLKVEGLSKKFCKNLRKSMSYGTLDITRSMIGLPYDCGKLRESEFWAVDDINFELKRGESLGLIGRNGCGKTTLLRMINGIFPPDKGSISIKGRIGALIAVGAGFHPHMSGRENVYLNGAILGIPKSEIKKNFDSIIDFAEIGNSIDAPVSTYSSGMNVRLGFSIAIHSQPDILLVDEILAVGDKDFQIKCYQKFNEVKQRGTTIVLVAHNEYIILEQTQKCLYLKDGRVANFGETEPVINHYLKDILTHSAEATSFVKEGVGCEMQKKAKVKSLRFKDSFDKQIDFIESGQKINIELDIDVEEKINNAIIGVNFYDNNGFMYCANSHYEKINFGDLSAGKKRLNITIPEFHLPVNNYTCSVIIAEQTVDNLIDWEDMAYRITVGRACGSRGSIKLKTNWSIS